MACGSYDDPEEGQRRTQDKADSRCLFAGWWSSIHQNTRNWQRVYLGGRWILTGSGVPLRHPSGTPSRYLDMWVWSSKERSGLEENKDSRDIMKQ